MQADMQCILVVEPCIAHFSFAFNLILATLCKSGASGIASENSSFHNCMAYYKKWLQKHISLTYFGNETENVTQSRHVGPVEKPGAAAHE